MKCAASDKRSYTKYTNGSRKNQSLHRQHILPDLQLIQLKKKNDQMLRLIIEDASPFETAPQSGSSICV